MTVGEPRAYRAAADASSNAGSLTSAFLHDPLLRTLVPNEEAFRTLGRRTLATLTWALDASYGLTDVICDEAGTVVCTAIWEPAGMTCGALCRFVLMSLWMVCVLGLRRAFCVAGMLLAFETRRHQHAPTAHHLQLLGTRQSEQSRGVGSKLIQVGIRRAEKLGLPCYLEASNERSVPFYKRHGFKVVETYYHFEGGVDGDGNRIVGRGPVVTLMFRPLGGVAH